MTGPSVINVSSTAARLSAKSAVIDGEAVVLGSTGLPDYQALERELGWGRSERLIFYAIDLLHLNGQDLRRRLLIERKSALQKLLAGAPPGLIYAEHLALGQRSVRTRLPHGAGRHRVQAHRRHLPLGSAGELAEAQMREERQLPDRCLCREAWCQSAPHRFALHRRREGVRLAYAGKPRSRYTEQTARALRERLDPLIIRKSPLTEPIVKPKATWIRPEVLAEVSFSGITDRGVLREAVIKGLRENLSALPPPRPVAHPKRTPGSTHGVPRENILQLLSDAVSTSKEELARYWEKVAEAALVHLGNRPLKLVRHTHGITFYHMGPLPEFPNSVHRLKVKKRAGGEGVRVCVDDLDGLLGLVAMDAVELHPWNATVDNIERADRIVLDLNPGEGVAWRAVTDAAMALRELLAAEGLSSWPKVTGGKGLHIMALLETSFTHEAARRLARRVAGKLAETQPGRFVLAAAPHVRKGHIFIDYLRNGRGNTAVGTFSPRARSGFPVAYPVTWRDVEHGVMPDAFTMAGLIRKRAGKAA